MNKPGIIEELSPWFGNKYAKHITNLSQKNLEEEFHELQNWGPTSTKEAGEAKRRAMKALSELISS